MKKNILLDKDKKIHFIGVGGVCMSALAKHLHQAGFSVSGSDVSKANLRELKKLGLIVFNKHHKDNVNNSDIVVYNSAISDDNEELISAKKKGLKILKRSELLGQIFSQYDFSIAISGSHGKTTATAMLSNILIDYNLDPTIFLGGEDKNFGNYRKGNSKYIVAEACEYKKNFLDMPPNLAVILNIDNDHLDCYKDISEIVDAFYEFSKNSITIINADDENASLIFNSKSITFGITKIASIMAKNISYDGKGYSFSVYAYGKRLGRIRLNIEGKHNIYNALAVIATSEYLKIPFKNQKKSLERFCSVKRRNEFLGTFYDMDIYADYAHHPKEIFEMMKTYKQNKKTLIVFQPHTYSRTKLLMQEFVSCLNNDFPLIIFKTYPAREKYLKSGSAKILYENIKGVRKEVYYAKNQQELVNILKSYAKEGYRGIFIGAGNIYDYALKIVKNYKKLQYNEKKLENI